MTYLYNVLGICKFLRIDVLKRFLFPQPQWDREWKYFWAEGNGAELVLIWNRMPHWPPSASSAARVRKNGHKPSRFPGSRIRSNQTIRPKEKKGTLSGCYESLN